LTQSVASKKKVRTPKRESEVPQREIPLSGSALQRGFLCTDEFVILSFSATWPDRAIVQGPLARITWYHNTALLEKVSMQAVANCLIPSQ
jgi:hypothetical protein